MPLDWAMSAECVQIEAGKWVYFLSVGAIKFARAVYMLYLYACDVYLQAEDTYLYAEDVYL